MVNVNIQEDELFARIGRQTIMLEKMEFALERANAQIAAAARLLGSVAAGVLQPSQLDVDLTTNTWRIKKLEEPELPLVIQERLQETALHNGETTVKESV